MNHTANTLFLRKLLVFLLIFCFAPQLLCTVLRYIGEYSGNDLVFEIIDVFVSVAGTAAVFIAYGAFICVVFLFGTRYDVLIPSVVSLVLYGLSYILMLITESYTVGIVSLSVSSIVSCAVFISAVSTAALHASLTAFFAALPYVAAFLTLSVIERGDAGDLIQSLVYGLMNLGLDFLMLVIAIGTAIIFANHAKRKSLNIVVGGSVVARGRPVLAAAMVVTVIYAASALAGYIPSTIEDVSEYGPPVTPAEIFETLYPYIRLAVSGAVGYFAAAFAVNRLEDKWFEASDLAEETDRLKRGRRKGK